MPGARRRNGGGGYGAGGGGPDLTLGEVFLDMRGDYTAAKASRFRKRRTGLALSGSGADFHVRSDSDYLKILEYARDMDRNDAVIGQMLDRAVMNMIQTGFTLDPQTGDKAIDDELWERWEEWATDASQCDIAGVHTFADMEFLVQRAMFLDGDIFAIPTQDGALELVEAHRCRTPSGTKKNVVNGIMLDEHRRRQEYWFTKDDIDPLQPVKLVGQVQAYPAYDEEGYPAVFHMARRKRVSQTRGISALAPIFDTCGMVDDILFAKLVQQQICSLFGFIRKRPSTARPGGVLPPLGARTQETQSDGTVRSVEDLSPGMNVVSEPGEEIEAFNSNVPNPEFFEHIKMTLTMVGINLGIPLVMLLMDARETNFSGWRGAINQAQMQFIVNQKMLMRQWHSEVYRWKVRQWRAEDAKLDEALKARDDKRKGGGLTHTWNAPRWQSIQPLDDAKADELRINARQTSPRRLHAEHGQDHDTVMAETIADNAYTVRTAIEEAKALSEETGEEIAWKELVCLQVSPKGNQGPAQDSAGAAGGDEEGDGGAEKPGNKSPKKAKAAGGMRS